MFRPLSIVQKLFNNRTFPPWLYLQSKNCYNFNSLFSMFHKNELSVYVDFVARCKNENFSDWTDGIFDNSVVKLKAQLNNKDSRLDMGEYENLLNHLSNVQLCYLACSEGDGLLNAEFRGYLDDILAYRVRRDGFEEFRILNFTSLLSNICHKQLYPNFIESLWSSLDGFQGDLSFSEYLNVLFLCYVARGKISQNVENLFTKSFLKHEKKMYGMCLSMYCIAYFRAQTPIRSHYVCGRILDVLEDPNIETKYNQTTLSALLKAFGHVDQRIFFTDRVMNIVENLLNNYSNLSFANTNHLCTLITTHKAYNYRLIDFALRKVLTEHENAREKDIERILRVVFFFDHLKPPYREIEQISDIMSRREMNFAWSFPDCLVMIVAQMALFGTYCQKLLDIMFSDKFMRLIAARSDLHNEYLMVSISMSLDLHPSTPYGVDKLNELVTMYSKSFKRSDSLHSLSRKNYEELSINEKLLVRCHHALKCLYAERYKSLHVLPGTYYPELIISSGKNNLEIDLFSPNNVKGCSIVLLQFKHQFIDTRSEHYSGYNRYRCRILEKIGFKLIKVKYSDIQNLSNNSLKEYLAKLTHYDTGSTVSRCRDTSKERSFLRFVYTSYDKDDQVTKGEKVHAKSCLENLSKILDQSKQK